MTTEDTSNGNGAAKDKKSRLQVVYEEWVAAGSLVPDEATRAAIKIRFKKCREAIARAEAALEKARAEEQKMNEETIRACGKAALNIDGTRFEPSCRGDTLYYRENRPEKQIEL